MIRPNIFYSNVKDLNIDKVKEFLPIFRIEKMEKLQKESDKKLSAGVWLLLCKVLKKYNINIDKYQYKTTDNGKPYLDGSKYHISYAHSGDFVIVGISKKPVGVDIEKIREIDTKISDLIFNEEDKKQLQNSTFFDVWTLKEAAGKQTGKGLSKEVKVDYENSCNINKIKGYSIGITLTKYKIKEIKL